MDNSAKLELLNQISKLKASESLLKADVAKLSAKNAQLNTKVFELMRKLSQQQQQEEQLYQAHEIKADSLDEQMFGQQLHIKIQTQPRLAASVMTNPEINTSDVVQNVRT
jgi:hypothetical protein